MSQSVVMALKPSVLDFKKFNLYRMVYFTESITSYNSDYCVHSQWYKSRLSLRIRTDEAISYQWLILRNGIASPPLRFLFASLGASAQGFGSQWQVSLLLLSQHFGITS